MSELPELFIENGIFHEYHYDEVISKSCAMYVAEERNRLSRVKRPLLVEFRDLRGYSPETRDMTLEFVLKSVNALAYFADKDTEEGRRTMRVIDTFFSITRWPIPVNVFTDREEAIGWLRQFCPDE